MKSEYIFYYTDESFDYGDFPGSICVNFEPHGFEIDIDKNGNIDTSTLSGFGHFEDDIAQKCKTLEDLLNYINKNLVVTRENEKIEEFKMLILKNLKYQLKKNVHMP